MNLLFICSRNEWRSRTAETIFRNHPNHHVRSAGTSKMARIRVNRSMLAWADIIFVMESHHKKRLQETFPDLLPTSELIVLDIPDEYPFMDPDLIQDLKDCVSAYLGEAF